MDFSFMSDLIGKSVRLERGGPDKVEGKLLAIMTDVLAIQTQKEGIVYVNGDHVKTISESVIPEIQIVKSAPVNTCLPVPEEEVPPLVEAQNFRNLLSQLRHKLIRVNQGGPNSLLGVLIDVKPNFESAEMITLLHDMKDYVHFPIYHVRSVTWIINQVRDDGANGAVASKQAHAGGVNADQQKVEIKEKK